MNANVATKIEKAFNACYNPEIKIVINNMSTILDKLQAAIDDVYQEVLGNQGGQATYKAKLLEIERMEDAALSLYHMRYFDPANMDCVRHERMLLGRRNQRRNRVGTANMNDLLEKLHVAIMDVYKELTINQWSLENYNAKIKEANALEDASLNLMRLCNYK